MAAGIPGSRVCADQEHAGAERHEAHVAEDPAHRQTGNRDVPLILGEVPHLVDVPATEDHAVTAAASFQLYVVS